MAKLLRPEHLELSNGIPVILQHYDGPVAATYWWVKTGSADENPPEAGFAHFLEHMLFKDAAAKETGKASTGKMARAVESLGGDINAYTSFDQTVYHVTCAATHWLKVLDAFGTMAKPQRFLKSDFESEREVILEELRKNEDSPGRQLFQALFTQTFRKHPYGKPVIGYTETLKAAKVGALEAFYNRNYVSGQMGIILVGPLEGQGAEGGTNKQQLLRYLEKHYGKSVLKPRAPSAHKRVVEPELKSKASFVVKPFDVKTPTLSFSFRVPELKHEDVPALDLLAGVLGMGELSRLHQKLFVEKSLVTEVSGGMYVPYDPGMLYFQAELESVDKVNDAAEEILKEFRRIRDEGPDADELARVIVNAESERLYATQSADGLAGRLGFLKFIVDDLDFDQKYIEELRAVDSARIREVARKYLDPRRMSGVVLVPKSEKGFKTAPIEVMTRELLGPARDEGKKAPARAAAKVERPPVEIFKLPSGIRVAHFERGQSHVVGVHASVLGGVRLEKPEDWGTAYMMSLTWAKGTQSRDAREIARITEGAAAGVDGFSGRNSVGAQLTGLARDWDKLSTLFTDVLLNPTFPDSEVAQYKRVAEDSIRGIEDHTSQLCSKLFLETLFEKHPYGRMTMGSLETLANIDGAKLRDYHRRWVRPERLVISISGDVPRADVELWLAQMDQWARALKARGAGENDAAPAEEPQLKAPRWVERNLGREQLHILTGGLGTTIHGEDRHAIQIMNTLLGGQSGRLFIELREKKSLAYTVSPVSFEGLERGYIGTYIACSPSKREEALNGIRKVLTELAEKGPTDKEMERAKEYYLGRRAMDLQGDSSLAAHYGLEVLYDLPILSERDIVKKVRAISAKEVRDVCRRFLVEPHMVTSVVG